MKKTMMIALCCLLALGLVSCAKKNGTGDNGGIKVEKNPVVTITMEDGATIKVELYPDKAPNTVCNFISLASKNYYDGITFHRIIEGFMIQGGDPEGTGYGGPGYMIKGEFPNNGHKSNDLKHTAGVISMARAGGRNYNTAGSQFFIMVAASSHLDGDYAAFGKVMDEESLAVCMELSKVEVGGPNNDRPVNPPKIKTVTVETFGETYPEPEKVS